MEKPALPPQRRTPIRSPGLCHPFPPLGRPGPRRSGIGKPHFPETSVGGSPRNPKGRHFTSEGGATGDSGNVKTSRHAGIRDPDPEVTGTRPMKARDVELRGGHLPRTEGVSGMDRVNDHFLSYTSPLPQCDPHPTNPDLSRPNPTSDPRPLPTNHVPAAPPPLRPVFGSATPKTIYGREGGVGYRTPRKGLGSIHPPPTKSRSMDPHEPS